MSEREGGSGNSQGVTEYELELTRTSKDAFDNHRYESCLSALNKLLEVRRHDARVAHNRAIAQYLLSNLTLTDEFRKSLHTVNMQFDRDAESCGMQASISDKGVLLFNQALIHMRLHQNTQATELLEQLCRVHDALGEPLSVEVCLLLIETYLTTYRLDKAASRMEYLEGKLFGGSLGGNGKGEGEGEGDPTPSEYDQYRPRLHLFKAWLLLQHRNMKSCKKELKCFTSTTGNTPCAQFLKANVEYLRQNYRKALKVLGSAPKSPIVTDAGECLSAFYFNNIGCVHFQLGKYSLAAHYFRKATEENDAALNGFPPLDRATPLSGRPLSVLGMNYRNILLYNLGLQQLYAGQPLAAFDSLMEVVQVYHANARLWLRLAEASIASHIKMQEEQLRLWSNKSETVQMVFGAGLHRKLVLNPVQWEQWIKKGHMDAQLHPQQSAAMPAPTLEFASISLRNALFLLPLASPAHSQGEKDGTHQATVTALPASPIQGNDIISLRCSVLVCLAYVSLGLGDPVTAHAHCRQLLEIPRLPGGLRFLGQLYMAEALVHLGRVQEALQYLNPDSVGDITTSLPYASTQHMDQSEVNQTEQPPTRPISAANNTFPSSVFQARAVTLFNLASVFCIRKEIEKARKALQQATSLFSEVPYQVILLSAYIEIVSGNTSTAIQIVKKHQPLPFGLLDKKRGRKPSYLAVRQ